MIFSLFQNALPFLLFYKIRGKGLTTHGLLIQSKPVRKELKIGALSQIFGSILIIVLSKIISENES